jgi:hypothetical protein
MIRIDEIYNNTFWPWIKKQNPGSRMFFCDPPGRTDPDALFNHGVDDAVETDYVFFHDQEPVHLDLHTTLFQEVVSRNTDIHFTLNFGDYSVKVSFFSWGDLKTKYKEYFQNFSNSDLTDGFFARVPSKLLTEFVELNPKLFKIGHVIVSERGEYVEQLEKAYGWKSHYYFYHGWACKDWFRGYDKTFLIPRARDRAPTHTFMSPNRIVAGKRDHRVLFLYNVFKHGLEKNYISAPRVCPYEGVDISEIALKYSNIYSDIEQVFQAAELPRLFEGEETQIMTSCWLGNYTEAQDSLVYVPTETVYFGRRLHITEKTFKAIALEMPFVLVAPAGSLEYMRSYGFKTFSDVFDESYDEETNDVLRIEKVTRLLKDLDGLSAHERQDIHRACLSAVEHNYEHFYGTGLEKILWQELQDMLRGLQTQSLS